MNTMTKLLLFVSCVLWFFLGCQESILEQPHSVEFIVDLHNQDISTKQAVGNSSLFEIFESGQYKIYTTAIFDTLENIESFTYIAYDNLEKPAFVVDANFFDIVGQDTVARYYVVFDDDSRIGQLSVYSGTYYFHQGFYTLEPDHYSTLNPDVPPLNTIRINWALLKK